LSTQVLDRITTRLEPIIVVSLLLYFTGANLPHSIKGLVNTGSYGLIGLLFLGMGRWQRCAYVATRDIWLILALGVTVASFFWSFAPAYTSDEVKALIRATLFGVYLAARYSPKEQMRLFAWTVGIGAVLSTIAAIAIPSYGISTGVHQGLWKGIYAHKQYLGRIMTVGFTPLLFASFDNWKYKNLAFLGAILAVLLVLLSQSKTSLILLILSIFLIPLYRFARQQYKLRVILLILALLITGSIAILVVSNIETIVVDILGKNLELSARTPIWELAIEKGRERLWFGYGYAGFWTSDAASIVFSQTWAGSVTNDGETRFHAHNGFIDVFLQIGLVGLAFCILSFFGTALRAIKLVTSIRGIENFWMLHFLIITLLFNVTETRTFLSIGTFWSLTVSMSLSTVIYCDRLRRHQQYSELEQPPKKVYELSS
jgi:O-antigen ligase